MTDTKPLDTIDQRILNVMAHDGRISINDLADRIGLSASPTLRRLRRLEESGVIRGYHADINPQAIGRGLTVWVTINIPLHDPEELADFEQALVAIDAVSSVYHVTGDVDYLVRVDIADLDAYDQLIRRQFPELPGAAHITSYVVTSTPSNGHHAAP